MFVHFEFCMFIYRKNINIIKLSDQSLTNYYQEEKFYITPQPNSLIYAKKLSRIHNAIVWIIVCLYFLFHRFLASARVEWLPLVFRFIGATLFMMT